MNAGVNGMHPIAMEGFARISLRHLRQAHLLVHCNLLWLSSPERDLSAPEEVHFNHAMWCSQLPGRIPAYHEEWSQRVSVAVRRSVPLAHWVQHVRLTCFDGQPLPEWTLEHPSDSVFARLGRLRNDPLMPSDQLRHQPRSWQEQSIPLQDHRWVALEQSLQWRAFRELVTRFRERGNRVCVVIGPFNQHLLTEASRAEFVRLREGVANWLREHDFPFYSSPLLPSEEYADASHPLAAGYERLARQMERDPVSRNWLVSGAESANW